MEKPDTRGYSVFTLEMVVFILVSASFTNVYITQPIQPVLGEYFKVSPVEVSFTVSIVIWGIVVSNLFFGYLADKVSLHPIIATGGLAVSAGSIACALTDNFELLVGARFLQGLFIPALTTSLSAWLARNLPVKSLKVVMGSYVSATVFGALGGRILGGWVFADSDWRYSFWTAGILTMFTTILSLFFLPNSRPDAAIRKEDDTFFALIKRKELLLIFAVGAGILMTFSPLLNFLPYRLTGPDFRLTSKEVTMVYLVYALGIFIGPFAGRISNRYGGGKALLGGTIILGLSLALLLQPSLVAVVLGLFGACAGFFTVHSVAVGLLNSKLTTGHGKANALYILSYYTGGAIGISLAGLSLEKWGWNGVIGFLMVPLVIPFITALIENHSDNNANSSASGISSC